MLGARPGERGPSRSLEQPELKNCRVWGRFNVGFIGNLSNLTRELQRVGQLLSKMAKGRRVEGKECDRQWFISGRKWRGSARISGFKELFVRRGDLFFQNLHTKKAFV